MKDDKVLVATILPNVARCKKDDEIGKYRKLVFLKCFTLWMYIEVAYDQVVLSKERWEGNSYPIADANFRDENSLRGEDCNTRENVHFNYRN